MLILVAVATSFSLNAFAKMVSPKGHEAIKAKVIKDDPSDYTINVKMLRNMGVDEEAETFAVYISSRLPKECDDFSSLEIPYSRPKKYLRRFDLSSHMDVYDALQDHKCVVIKNIPSQ